MVPTLQYWVVLGSHSNNGSCCFRNFWNHVPFCPLCKPPLSGQPWVLFPSNFGTVVLLSQRLVVVESSNRT